MPIMRPISKLRNYGVILRECKDGEPVYLTRNGRECYVLVDVREYERLMGRPISRTGTASATRQEIEEMEFFCELVED